jgi:hypothetical protein
LAGNDMAEIDLAPTDAVAPAGDHDNGAIVAGVIALG